MDSPEITPDPAPAEVVDTTPADAAEPTEEEITFSADDVRKLRAEATEHRLKAKAVRAEANARLLAQVILADGRLIDPDALTVTDELLDDSGYVDAAKVAEVITNTIADKPYLSAQKPHTVIPQGARDAAPAAPSIGDLIRARM